MLKKTVCCYRSGPIERDPAASFHAKNQLDGFLREAGIEIIGDTFEYLNSIGAPQAEYSSSLKRLRDQGCFQKYCEAEKLLTYSLRHVRKADFIISRPAPEASGGTVSETAVAWLEGIPKLVIIGPYGEGLLDNDSTFMIKMMTDRFSLVFNAERDIREFIEYNLEIFKSGKEAIRKLIVRQKKDNPYFNDQPQPHRSEKFDGKTVIIQGLPGSGKDTQARLLQDFCGFKFFGSGHELRRLSSRFPVLGESLDRGNLAPEIIINFLMAESIVKLEKFEPIVFSGAPKKLSEARGLMELLAILGRKPTVIILDIDKELSRERITLRRNCDTCETSYCQKKQVENPICPRCRGPLKVREENSSEDAIKKIFDWYETDVKEVIRFFEENKDFKVHWVLGDDDKFTIYKKILEILAF